MDDARAGPSCNGAVRPKKTGRSMRIFRTLLKQTDTTAAELREGFESWKLFHEMVFTTIEGMAIIAAIQILLDKESSYIFSAIQMVAYSCLLMHLVLFFNLLLRATAERFELVDKSRDVFLWISGLLSLAFSWTVIDTVPKLVAKFVSAKFLQG
jgi:hypothetical protein